MAALPASPVPTISPAEMQILISRSGLVLNPGQMADLVLAWRQVAGLIAALPQGRPLTDDMAYSFRLQPAVSNAGTAAPPGPAAEAAARPRVVAAAKPRAKPKRAVRSAAKPSARSAANPSAKAAAARSRAKPKAGGKSKARPKPQAARRRAPRGR